MILGHSVQEPIQASSRRDLEATFLKAIGGHGQHLLNEQIRSINEADLKRLTHRLTRLRDRCGCATGAWFAVIAAVASAVVAVVHGASDAADVVVLIAMCMGCVVLAGAVGKVLALLIHRIRWRIERHRIMAMLPGAGT
jgi:hypothetical protein